MVGTLEGEDCCGTDVGASREVLEGFMARERKRETEELAFLSFHEVIIIVGCVDCAKVKYGESVVVCVMCGGSVKTT